MTKAQLTDSGIYQCVAVNKAGQDSVDFELTVLGTVSFRSLRFFPFSYVPNRMP